MVTKPYKKLTEEWLNQWNWAEFITLTTGEDIDVEKARKHLEKVMRRLSKKVFGRRTKKHICAFAIVEQKKGGLNHIHMLIEEVPTLSRERLINLISYFWSGVPNTLPAGHLENKADDWFISIYDQKGLINYLFKTIHHKDMQDRIIMDHLSILK